MVIERFILATIVPYKIPLIYISIQVILINFVSVMKLFYFIIFIVNIISQHLNARMYKSASKHNWQRAEYR